LYISKIQLEGIRSFENISLDLNSANHLSMWALILGDNGTGKTTLLRSIAMGLSDAASASALLKELSGDTVRAGANEGTIQIELIDENSIGTKFSIETKISRSPSGNVEVTQTTEPKNDFPWGKIFATAYGAGRSIHGLEGYEKYSTVDSVYTLFNYESTLQNPEVALYRLNRFSNIRIEDILLWIDKILMLPEGSTTLTKGGIAINGPWGTFQPSGAVGDGYQATLAFIVDVISWWGLFQEQDTLDTELKGIVLVDEIEQHLHPKWQQSIIRLLHHQFPKVQFIGSTHSPLCAIGSAALSDEECELVLLRYVDGHTEGIGDLKPPRRKRADQVLTSYLFDLDTTRSDEVVEDIERYSSLKGKPTRSEEEERELAVLHNRLNEELGGEETDLQRIVGKAMRETLHKLEDTSLSTPTPPPEAINFEIRRQVQKLFGLGRTNDQD
jgi:energy-coupling factor transporter ATP-binding protein EcfA2